MLQNMRAYSIVYIAIKWIVCVQEKLEFSCMSQTPGLSSTKTSGDFS